MVKSKLPPRSGCSLDAVEPHPKKEAIKFFFFFDNKSKYSSNPKDIFKSAKKIIKNSTSSKLAQLLLLNLLGKFLTERKYLRNTLIFVRLKYLDEIKKSINYETNNKPPQGSN